MWIHLRKMLVSDFFLAGTLLLAILFVAYKHFDLSSVSLGCSLRRPLFSASPIHSILYLYEDQEESLTEELKFSRKNLSEEELCLRLLARANARVRRGKIAEALTDYELAEQADPNYGNYDRAFMVAFSLAEKGHYKEADRLFRTLATDFPRANSASYAHFLCHTHQKEWRRPALAVQLARQACSYQPNGGSRFYRRLLAQSLASNEQFTEAIQEAELALFLPSERRGDGIYEEREIFEFIARCKEEETMYSEIY